MATLLGTGLRQRCHFFPLHVNHDFKKKVHLLLSMFAVLSEQVSQLTVTVIVYSFIVPNDKDPLTAVSGLHLIIQYFGDICGT